MALPLTVANVTALIADAAPQAIEDGLTEESFLYDRIRKAPPSDAKGPRWRLVVSGNESTGSFTPGGSLNAADARQTVEASESWAWYHGSFKLAEAQLQMISKAGPHMLTNEVVEQLAAIASGLADDIHSAIISGTSGLIGLGVAIDDSTTYFNVNRSTYPAMAAYDHTNSGTPRAITAALLNATWNYLTYTNKGRATVLFCDSDQWDAIAALTTGAITTQANMAAAGGGSQSKFVGYTDLYYKGLPVVAIPGYTSGRVDFVDEAKLSLEVIKPFGLVPDGQGKLGPQLEGGTYTWLITGGLQLVLRNPKKSSASLTDLS